MMDTKVLSSKDTDFCFVSLEDKTFVSIMENEVKQHDGHYYLPLPLRHSDVQFPNNKIQANQRAEWLKSKTTTKRKKVERLHQICKQLIEQWLCSKS